MTSATETFASEAPPGGESPAQFEDDFDIPPIHLPPSALGTVFNLEVYFHFQIFRVVFSLSMF